MEMKEEWLMPGAVVPVDAETTAALVAEIKRLIGVVGDMALNMQPAQQQKEGFASPGGGYVPAIPRPIPLDWKLVPRKATPEMLRAMDECAQEGYDERLYEGMASSVYMAAWDASPVLGTLPPSEKERSMMDIIVGNLVRKGINKHRARELAEHFIKHTSPPKSKPWVGLTEEEVWQDDVVMALNAEMGLPMNQIMSLIVWADAKLREKNAQPSKPLTDEQANDIMEKEPRAWFTVNELNDWADRYEAKQKEKT